MADTILQDRDGRVAILTVNRPDKLNALNDQVREDLLAALTAIEHDDGVGVVVITGAGEKASSPAPTSQSSPAARRSTSATPCACRASSTSWRTFPKPVIAMVNGFCLGGGCELAMSCDMLVASDKARFGQPEINLGLIPGGGGTQRLPRRVGLGQSMRMILSGDMIPAAEARDIGLVDLVFPAEELRARTLELAQKIASKSPLTLKVAKEAVRNAYRLPIEEGILYERDLFCLCFSSQDKEEGVAAFLEKRPAKWSGR